MSGLMFKDTLTWSPATGCDHYCPYCSAYIDTFPRVSATPKYSGRGWSPTVHWDMVRKGPPNTKRANIFVVYMGDLFCSAFHSSDIHAILSACHGSKYKGNFLLLTKNSPRYLEILGHWPELAEDKRFVWGCSIETTQEENPMLSKNAPKPFLRALAMRDIRFRFPELRMFLCLEPIMEFDRVEMAAWIGWVKPEFIYIGYDNHGHIPGDQEPSRAKVNDLIDIVNGMLQTEWRLKTIREARR